MLVVILDATHPPTDFQCGSYAASGSPAWRVSDETLYPQNALGKSYFGALAQRSTKTRIQSEQNTGILHGRPFTKAEHLQFRHRASFRSGKVMCMFVHPSVNEPIAV